MKSNERRFRELQQKFDSVLKFVERENIYLQNVDVQDDKLLLRVAVPSEEMRAALLEVIGAVDPSYEEIHPDIRVEAHDNVPHSGQTNVQSGLEFSR
jgi:hypothetical protein